MFGVSDASVCVHMHVIPLLVFGGGIWVHQCLQTSQSFFLSMCVCTRARACACAAFGLSPVIGNIHILCLSQSFVAM
jgi:hypothetical protein